MKTGSFGGMYFNSPLLVMYFGNPSNDDIPHLAIVPALERNDTDELVGLAELVEGGGPRRIADQHLAGYFFVAGALDIKLGLLPDEGAFALAQVAEYTHGAVVPLFRVFRVVQSIVY